jgi:metal-responsive CopG/Arc/MetJ family transcriptional regulator
MSKIISVSVDDDFAEGLEGLMAASGYKNRSRFLRDAAIAFADVKQRGELETMDDDLLIEGHLVIYFQHQAEAKLVDVRHSDDLNITSYNHNCLSHSHTCVDVMHAIGTAENFRTTIVKLQNITGVDKVSFVVAPLREDGCC